MAKTTSGIEARLEAEGYASYYRVGSPHPPEWQEPHYLGMSTLVKRRATDYAKRIINQEAEAPDPEQNYWGFIGNSLAEAHLRHLTPHREIRIQLPHPDSPDWALIGHADGITLVDNRWVVVDECKAHGTIEEDKVALARRQAFLYLASIAECIRGEDAHHFDLADFQHEEAQPLTLSEGRHDLWGIRIHISPRFGPPALVEATPVSPLELSQVWDFYRRKSKAILDSVKAGTLDAALAWDRSPEGLVEFTRREVAQVVSGPDAGKVALWASLSSKADEAKALRESAQSEMKAWLRQSGLSEATLEDGTRLKLVGDWGASKEPWVKVSPPRKVIA